MSYQYCLLTTPDKDDPNGYCRHRICRFCRVCKRLTIEKCTCGKTVGFWESSPIKYMNGTVRLPFGGKSIPKSNRVKRPNTTYTRHEPNLEELPKV